MNKISVFLSSSICFRNTGMFSVDYAAYKFFKSNFDCELKFYVFHLSDEKYYPYEELVPYSTYNKITKENLNDVYESDLIVYWSDFFHTRHFLQGFMENYIFSKSYDVEADRDLFFKAFFLENAPYNVFKKTIVFGNSLMFLEFAEEHRCDRYARNFNNFYSKIVASMPRDSISFEKIKSFNFENLFCYQGCDPAFLLPRKKLPKENRIGLFIGRRTEIKLSDVFELIKYARKTDMKIEWIDWMINTESFFIRSIKNPRQAKNLFLHCALAAIFHKKKKFYNNDLTSLSRYSLVVTDTYHLSINALKESVPVFCIGSGEVIYGKKELDLHDGKKEVLFDMLGIDDYYVEKLNCDKMINRRNVLLDGISFVDNAKNKLKHVCNLILEFK